jgi:hypothetical protein
VAAAVVTPAGDAGMGRSLFGIMIAQGFALDCAHTQRGKRRKEHDGQGPSKMDPDAENVKAGSRLAGAGKLSEREYV